MIPCWFGIAAVPAALSPMMLPSIRLSSAWTPVPPSETTIASWLLPEITFPAPAAVPPTTVVAASTTTTPPVLETAAVPAAFVPM